MSAAIAPRLATVVEPMATEAIAPLGAALFE